MNEVQQLPSESQSQSLEEEEDDKVNMVRTFGKEGISDKVTNHNFEDNTQYIWYLKKLADLESAPSFSSKIHDTIEKLKEHLSNVDVEKSDRSQFLVLLNNLQTSIKKVEETHNIKEPQNELKDIKKINETILKANESEIKRLLKNKIELHEEYEEIKKKTDDKIREVDVVSKNFTSSQNYKTEFKDILKKITYVQDLSKPLMSYFRSEKLNKLRENTPIEEQKYITELNKVGISLQNLRNKYIANQVCFEHLKEDSSKQNDMIYKLNLKIKDLSDNENKLTEISSQLENLTSEIALAEDYTQKLNEKFESISKNTDNLNYELKILKASDDSSIIKLQEERSILTTKNQEIQREKQNFENLLNDLSKVYDDKELREARDSEHIKYQTNTEWRSKISLVQEEYITRNKNLDSKAKNLRVIIQSLKSELMDSISKSEQMQKVIKEDEKDYIVKRNEFQDKKLNFKLRQKSRENNTDNGKYKTRDESPKDLLQHFWLVFLGSLVTAIFIFSPILTVLYVYN